MLGQAISTYKKIQMDFIGKLSMENKEIINEVPFFDEGYLSTQINRLKEEHARVCTELKIAYELNLDSKYEEEKRKKLRLKRDSLEIKMLHYAVNSLNSLEMCKVLAKGKNLKIEKLISALELYKDNDKEAITEFALYFLDNAVDKGYYLGNKLYGKLLLENGKADIAREHLEYAVQMRVDDVELLTLLEECYKMLRQTYEEKITKEVLQILG